jgi:preprotein translocase subunit SecE
MFNKIANFITDVRSEMSKVSWPTVEELRGSTFIVALVSVLFAVFVFFADVILASVIGMFF